MAYTANLNRVHAGAAANTTGNVVFTFAGTGLAAGGAVLRACTLVNSNTTTKAHVTGNLCANNVAVATANEIFEVDVPPGDTLIVRGPWYENSNATVVIKSDVATLVCRVTANELT